MSKTKGSLTKPQGREFTQVEIDALAAEVLGDKQTQETLAAGKALTDACEVTRTEDSDAGTHTITVAAKKPDEHTDGTRGSSLSGGTKDAAAAARAAAGLG